MPTPPVSPSRNLVMSMAYGYPYHRFEVFVRSLRGTGYSGDILLFTNFTAEPERDRRRGGRADDPRIPVLLSEHNVTFVDVGTTKTAAPSWVHAKLARYLLYAKFAAKSAYAEGLVLVLDFRDVVFQADPFANVRLRGEWLRFYEELFPPTIRQSRWTFEWIQECWGDAAAERVANAVIVCSGATMGTAAGIVHYATTMATAIQSAPRPQCIDHDQRYHNYLLYTGRFKQVRLLRAGHAEVYNLGYIGRHNRSVHGLNPERWRHIDDITVRQNDGSSVVLNEDGAPAAVLHQYDRVDFLARDVRAQYVTQSPREH